MYCPARAVSHTREHTQVPQEMSPEKVAAELKKLESLANKVRAPPFHLFYPSVFLTPPVSFATFGITSSPHSIQLRTQLSLLSLLQTFLCTDDTAAAAAAAAGRQIEQPRMRKQLGQLKMSLSSVRHPPPKHAVMSIPVCRRHYQHPAFLFGSGFIFASSALRAAPAYIHKHLPLLPRHGPSDL
jgi:hypothetical protein